MLKTIIFISVVTLNTCLLAKEMPSKNPVDAISIDSLKKHIEVFGSDSLLGRGTGSIGIKKAAKYIAAHLEKLKIETANAEKTYFQHVPMHGSIPQTHSKLYCFSADTSRSLTLEKDYLLYKTGAPTIIPQPLPLVFVGYGIVAPEFDYNDYQSLEVEGKIVVFLSGEPTSRDPAFFNGTKPTIYSSPESKHRIAVSRGAKGSIMVLSPADKNLPTWEEWVRIFAFENITLAYSVSANFSIVINPLKAGLLFNDSDYNMNQIVDMDINHTMHSFPLATKVAFKGEFIERDFQDSNVIGLINGRSEKAVIISAHYDHLGIGPPVAGDSIYNGVNDNAMGVAAAMEIARLFSIVKSPRHSIIFLFTTGEEKGLLGSTYYVDHPVIPLYRSIANINVDGLAILDQFNDVVGVGADLSTLGEELNHTASALGMNVSAVPSQFLASESFARSDQIVFAKAGVPSILIAEGLNYKNLSPEEGLRRMIQWMENIYHSPFDDLRQPINWEAVKQHCQFIFAFCYSIAQNKRSPEWKPGTPYINARLLSIAERR